jgi:predicted nucleic acid-binding protein
VPFVLDASIVGSWCLHDEDDPRANAAYELLYDDHALVPLQWWFEVRNVVLMGERRQRVSEAFAAAFLAKLARCPIELAALPEQSNVFTLARRHRLTFYDAAYLELAHRERIALATLDEDLANAARADGIALITSPR